MMLYYTSSSEPQPAHTRRCDNLNNNTSATMLYHTTFWTTPSSLQHDATTSTAPHQERS
jgi:hypothetical protein